MNFKHYYEEGLEAMADYERFVNDMFVGNLAGQESDFYYFLRNRGLGKDDFKYEQLGHIFKDWVKSKKRGRFEKIHDVKRRQEFGPGKYWAASPAGVHLNKNFVKGWRGINPVNP